jgi:predicted Fe-Mo cluster-binding NifX family protein
MRIAVTSTGPSLDAAVDPRFGRCSFFVFVETEGMTFEASENASGSLGGGAGIQSALAVAQKGAKAVLTGNCGPNAHQTLSAAGIDVFVGCSGTVSETVARFKSGQLRVASVPNVASHAGMSGGRR